MTTTSEVLEAIKKRLVQLDHEAAVLREAYAILGQSAITVKPTQYVTRREYGRRKVKVLSATGTMKKYFPNKSTREYTIPNWLGIFKRATDTQSNIVPVKLAKMLKVHPVTVRRAMTTLSKAKAATFKRAWKGVYKFKHIKPIKMEEEE